MFGIFKRKKNNLILRVRISPYYLTDIDKSLKVLKKVLSPTAEEFTVISWSVNKDDYFNVYVSPKEYQVLTDLLEGKMEIRLKQFMQRDEGGDRKIAT